MIRVLDSLAARTAVVAVLGIVVVHLASLWTYEHAIESERHAVHATRLADQLVVMKRTLALVPPAEREGVAHDLSGGALDAHWSREQITARGPGAPAASEAGRAADAPPPQAPATNALAAELRTLAPELGASDVVVGAGADPHLAVVGLRLPDGSWLNVRLFATAPPPAGGHGSVLSTSLMAAGVLLLSLAISVWLTRPLRAMAKRVAGTAPDAPLAPLPETGPREVRELAHAFNGMQARIADLIARRTRALAAVSHDLRTPMTRLRFRLEEIPEPDLRAAMAADIGEMEQMVEATLSYLRGDAEAEPVRALDLVPLLTTLVDDARDRGLSATLEAPATLVVPGRLVALKRAISNLLDNALAYGGAARLSLSEADGWAVLTVADDGPGIPEEQLAAVLEPFVRLEASRSRATGGVGLGLTIADAAIRAHGGTLSLANRPQGGLTVTVRLPRTR
ncbi:two-component sensor histidine kinase [Xanthobacter dioxanivorans]|uniref:histidine kinase n=1 Tax=Xanthobacter dioxanivorans TaxID=2528964 RepID=A0A974SFZ9_9HYPH|nr:ATP-binding protein [Xanthobacter dioxanivorans]QRG04781.1 two-component sensor histidine kinase [Xanthobacter dioxanivorans]